MKLPSSLRLLRLAFGLATAGLFLAPPAPAATAAPAAPQLYTCSMHPQIIKDAPGDCPVCGMKLTPIRANSSGGERKIKFYKSTMLPGEVSAQPGNDSMGMAMEPVYTDDPAAASTIRIDARTLQRMNLKTAAVTRGPVRRELHAVATVAFNERGLRDITTKYEGWIEQLHVNAIWTPVRAGDPLFDVYSPDLYNAQLNYLVALRAEGETGGPLTHASLARLQLFDVAPEFLAELARTGTAQRTYPFRSPAGGYVIEKMAVEGQMMRPGEKLYRLADLSTVWILAQIYEQDLPFVHDGQPATVRLSYGATRDFPATVDMVVPQVEALTRTATARLVLANPGGTLRPGMFVEVRLAAELAADAVLVPDTAVLRSGERNTVFLALPDGGFEPREITLGARSEGNFYQVLSGLAGGERVVTSGQFMLDSESQLREAIQKMLRNTAPVAPEADHTGHDHAPGAADHPPGATPAAKPQPLAALPPGHPPLDAATFAAFGALHPERAAPAEAACGSCGMSPAAMAAGEPCETGK